MTDRPLTQHDLHAAMHRLADVCGVSNIRASISCFANLYTLYREWGMTRRRAFYHAADCAIALWHHKVD